MRSCPRKYRMLLCCNGKTLKTRYGIGLASGKSENRRENPRLALMTPCASSRTGMDFYSPTTRRTDVGSHNFICVIGNSSKRVVDQIKKLKSSQTKLSSISFDGHEYRRRTSNKRFMPIKLSSRFLI